VAKQLAEGLAGREIARNLGKTHRTVKLQLGNIYRKMNLSDRRVNPYVKLAVWWNCELFQIGLKELGLSA